ncbi:MAG: polysaccharide lyase family protein [Verrucomicrobiae bacterium]|nr:polysaccharide lyase family protein [Verrucomicrobiae bacterium]
MTKNTATWILSAVMVGSTMTCTSQAQISGPAVVQLRETEFTYFLDNNQLQVRIEKASGEVASIRYQGREILLPPHPGRAAGAGWFNAGPALGGPLKSASVTISPQSNQGKRAEVAIRFYNAPGAPTTPLDVELRYALGQGESSLYTYAIWTHKTNAPAGSVSEAGFAARLNPEMFDYLTVNAKRRRQMPTGDDWDVGTPLNPVEARRLTTGLHRGEVEYKYDYAAPLYELPAYGWSSTKQQIGLWFINPSFEYLAGGPTKVELTGYLDTNPGGTPTLVNLWLGNHYGGSSLVVGENENWTKIIGPFAIYCNSGSTPEVMWLDALHRARFEVGSWPYEWVTNTIYPADEERSMISGQIQVKDPLDPQLQISNLWVGLTAPDYVPPRLKGPTAEADSANESATEISTTGTPTLRGGFPNEVDWQRDGKSYQFWIAANPNGKFAIPNVRPGHYRLRAIADGVIGEFVYSNVVVATSQSTNLGVQTWTPQRQGRTLWQIGVPDRTAREFRHGDHYWQWGLYLDYPKEFPNDVDYIIGRSDWRKDWNYVQPPRILSTNLPPVSDESEPTVDLAQYIRVSSREVEPTTWTIRFGLSQSPQGKATLRLAFCGTSSGCRVEAFVNEESIGDTGLLPSTGAMQRDGIRAFWVERPLTFDASLLQTGVNVIQLKSHATSWTQGVMYDVVRLELDEPVAGH